MLAAITKLRALDAFVGVVHNYRLVPEPLERPIAYALPVVELAIAVGVLLPAVRAPAALAAAILLVLFAGAMAINLMRGRRDIDCGCFATVLRQRLSWPLVLRNLLLAALALLVVPGLGARSLGWLDLVTVGCASTALVSRLCSREPAVRQWPPEPPGARLTRWSRLPSLRRCCGWWSLASP